MDAESPDFRITLRRDGVVRLVDWGPWLARSGPLYTLLDARGRAGVCIADLTVIRDEAGSAAELVVEVRCGDITRPEPTVISWAVSVGYRRVWLDGAVIELTPAPGGRAETRCASCHVRLVNADAHFWDDVRERGAFPSICCLCGADLPQWTVARQTSDGRGDPASSTPSRRTACK